MNQPIPREKLSKQEATAEIKRIMDDNMTPEQQGAGRLRSGLSPEDIKVLLANERFPTDPTALDQSDINLLGKIELKSLATDRHHNLFELLVNTGVIVLDRDQHYHFIAHYVPMIQDIIDNAEDSSIEVIEARLVRDIALDDQSPFSISLNQGEAELQNKVSVIYAGTRKLFLRKIGNDIESSVHNENMRELAAINISISLFLENLEDQKDYLFRKFFQDEFSDIKRLMEEKIVKHLKVLDNAYHVKKTEGIEDQRLLRICAASAFFEQWALALRNSNIADLQPIRGVIQEKLNEYNSPDNSHPELIRLCNEALQSLQTRTIKPLSQV